MPRRVRTEDEPRVARALDVCIHGQPVSAQTARRGALEAWKETVRIASQGVWPVGEPPIAGLVRLRVTFYCEFIIGDVDNIVKPIQDALQTVAYYNDRQISDVTGQRRSINGAFRVRYMSPALAMAFSDGRQFIHIEVWRDPNQEVVA